MKTKWYPYEIQELIELNQIGRTDNQIAVILGKSRKAIMSKRQHVGLKESPFSTAMRHCNQRKHGEKTEDEALDSIKACLGGVR